ncbi:MULTISPECIES: nuclear transport factor 2 family protein [Chryseobacterium]|uniref:nuclear transport factor 2 family protein n=1 Tax=Chryseobacterium TaxID=59732 RepID=UPI001BE74803|nr:MULTISPECIES: nuclear transport factor 2 family protein [Chryseobacterium]MBT2622273.1 nuclear transport factor 2 family protein [Chryseobacterium sp. ISL-6]
MELIESQAPIDVVSRYYLALGARNIEMIMKLFPEKLDWYVPGNETIAPWLGHRKTSSQVRAFFELLWQNTKPVSAKIDHIVTDGNVVLSSGSFETIMIKTGQNFRSLFFTEIMIIDGLIVKYTLLEDTFGLVKALDQ